MQEHDKIEDLFRKGLGNFEDEPDNFLWENIQREIKKPRKKQYTILLLAVLFFAGGTGGWYMLKHSTQPKTAQQPQNIAGGKREQNTTINKSAAEPASPLKGKPGATAISQSGYVPANLDKSDKIIEKTLTQTGQDNIQLGTYKEQKQGNIPDMESNESPARMTGIANGDEGSIAADTVFEELVAGADEKDSAAEKSLKKGSNNKEEIKKQDKSRFIVLVYAKPVLGGSIQTIDRRSYPTFVAEGPVQGKMAFGISGGYKLRNNITVSAGFEYFKAVQDFTFANYKWRFNHRIVKAITQAREVKYEVFTTSTLLSKDEHTCTNTYECYNYPLLAIADIYTRPRFGITAQAGVAYTALRWKSYNINDSMSYYTLGSSFTKKAGYLSLSVGAGINYNIGRRFMALARPEVGFMGKSLSFSNKNSKNYYYSISFGFGMKF